MQPITKTTLMIVDTTCDLCDGRLPIVTLCPDCHEDELRRDRNNIVHNRALRPKEHKATRLELEAVNERAADKYQKLSEKYPIKFD